MVKNGATDIDCRVISYSDVLSVEIFQDGKSVTRTSRASQIGGAIAGGLALGGAGAIIGELSGNTTTSETIKRIDLHLVVNDIGSPLRDITLMNSESKKGGYLYAEAMKHGAPLARHSGSGHQTRRYGKQTIEPNKQSPGCTVNAKRS